jgi:hypothetical protein
MLDKRNITTGHALQSMPSLIESGEGSEMQLLSSLPSPLQQQTGQAMARTLQRQSSPHAPLVPCICGNATWGPQRTQTQVQAEGRLPLLQDLPQ